MAKIYAVLALFNVRDIEFGKGLRKPFIESLFYLYNLGYKKLVNKLIGLIPRFGYYKDLCAIFERAEKLQLEDIKASATKFYA